MVLMMPPREALERLRQGNDRFASGGTRKEVKAGQGPFAIILGCSDSRVPPEIIFDQGLGNLFVVRVAGNVVASHQLGSLELAVKAFGIRLVVVLGHSECAAIVATLDELAAPTEGLSPHLGSIVSSIRPSLEPLLQSDVPQDRATLQARGVRANIHRSVGRILHDSPILTARIENHDLLVLGAEYSLASGRVEFLADRPELASFRESLCAKGAPPSEQVVRAREDERY